MVDCRLKRNKKLSRCKKKSLSRKKKLKTYLVDVEEMPETVRAKDWREARKIAEMHLGVMEKPR